MEAEILINGLLIGGGFMTAWLLIDRVFDEMFYKRHRDSD